jgi:polyphenol oxidase
MSGTIKRSIVTIELLRSSLLAGIPGVSHAFTTRNGGISPEPFASLNLSARVGDDKTNVESNRTALLGAIGRSAAVLVLPKQVHGDTVVEVTHEASRVIQADGVWTRDRSTALAVLVADCVPILMSAAGGKVVAAVHAGWRGTRDHVAARAIERLAAAGYPPGTVTVALGPAIGPCCYDIGTDVAQELRQAYPQAGNAIRMAADNRLVVDLWDLNRQALIGAGVPAANIDVMGECTACHPARFFSHRRDKGRCGRQAAVIAASVV